MLQWIKSGFGLGSTSWKPCWACLFKMRISQCKISTACFFKISRIGVVSLKAFLVVKMNFGGE